MIIAIDGPAASGKGTLAKRIAAHFDYPCLDTGLLYRAVARDCTASGGDLDDELAAEAAARALDPATLDDPRLRLPGAGDRASMVARFPAVRAALIEFQRAFAARPPGAVLDGRDIGTVICPEADIKLFVTADLAIRAQRRFEEQAARGETGSIAHTLDVIRGRDARDAGRPNAPLRMAVDAHVIDTSALSVDEAVAIALNLIAAKVSVR